MRQAGAGMSNLRATADRLIEAQGQAVTLTRRASGTYNPATGASAVTTSTQTGKGVILPLSAGFRHLGGTNIPAGSVQCLLSALNTAGAALTAPEVDDRLTDAAGKVWAITEVSPLEPAGTVYVYDLMLKAAA